MYLGTTDNFQNITPRKQFNQHRNVYILMVSRDNMRCRVSISQFSI